MSGMSGTQLVRSYVESSYKLSNQPKQIQSRPLSEGGLSIRIPEWDKRTNKNFMQWLNKKGFYANLKTIWDDANLKNNYRLHIY